MLKLQDSSCLLFCIRLTVVQIPADCPAVEDKLTYPATLTCHTSCSCLQRRGAKFCVGGCQFMQGIKVCCSSSLAGGRWGACSMSHRHCTCSDRAGLPSCGMHNVQITPELLITHLLSAGSRAGDHGYASLRAEGNRGHPQRL